MKMNTKNCFIGEMCLLINKFLALFNGLTALVFSMLIYEARPEDQQYLCLHTEL